MNNLGVAEKWLGKYLEYKGKPAKIIAYNDQPTVTIQDLETGEQFHEVIGCLNYQERVRPVETVPKP